MQNPHRVGELEITEDAYSERRGWRVQRIGWFAMGVVVIATLFGAFGRGWISHRVQGGPNDALRIEYDAVPHWQTATTIKVHARAATPAAELKIALDQSYLQDVDIDAITPEPTQVEVGEDAVIFHFAADRNAVRSGGRIEFSIKPNSPGGLRGAVAFNGERRAIAQFVLP